MRARFEALGLGIRRSAAGAVFALAGLTVRDAVRRKAFLILAVFTLVMLGATSLLPAVRPEDRVPLVETWAQRAIMFFGVLLTVFLSGVSIPEDIEDRRIFTLLSKPLSRWQLLAGRFAGYALLLAGFAFGGWVISAVFIRVVSAGAGSTLANVTEFDAREIHIEEEPGLSRVELAWNEQHPFQARLAGAGSSLAIFYFRSIDVDDLSPVVPIRVYADVASQNALSFGDVFVYLRPLPAAKVDETEAVRLGWTVGWKWPPQPNQPLPPRIASRKARLKSGIPLEFEVPVSWFDRNGGIDIAFQRAEHNMEIALHRRSIRVVSRPHNFEWNFAKALASTFCLWLVVLSATLAGSAVLSGPVNLVFGLAVFVFGSMVPFLQEALPQVRQQLQQAEEARVHEEPGHAGHDHSHGADDEVPPWLLKFSNRVSEAAIGVVPDLGRYDASVPILQGEDLPARRVAEGAAAAGLYVVCALTIGMGFLRMREFK